MFIVVDYVDVDLQHLHILKAFAMKKRKAVRETILQGEENIH
jgi:hypothetical protein